MIRGLYTSAQGMLNNQRRLETISNNLANINTNGYKKDSMTSKSFSDVMTEVVTNDGLSKVGTMSLGVGVGSVNTDYSQGNIETTDNPLDLAITNSNLAFFSVEVPDKNGNGTQEMYTRDGAFTINSLGQLTTKDGNIVKGQNGPIVLNEGPVVINSDGTILQNEEVVDKLAIKEFLNSDNLKKYGNNLIQDTGNSQSKEFSGQIIQGAVESSNVNSITEMVDMINVMRNYESNQKVLRAHDETLQKAVSEIGRV